MTKFRVACIGAGYFSRFHVGAWKRIPEVELVVICDLNIEKARAMAQEFSVPEVTDNIHSLATDPEIDVVDIITPPETHLDLCQLFVSHGKHIICQKPLAPSLSEAKKLVEVTTKGKGRFMVHENFRFQPWYRKIRSLLKEDAIGSELHTATLKMRMGDGWGAEAYLGRQPYFRTMERLLIYETGIHYIDVFRYLFGDITGVYARLRTLNQDIKGEDCALIVLDFERGGMGILDGNRYNESNYADPRYTFGETTIEGSGGTLRLYGDGKITVQKLGESEYEVPYQHQKRDFASDCVYHTQRHFIERLITGDAFETSGQDYLKNLVVQEAVYESAAKKIPIEI